MDSGAARHPVPPVLYNGNPGMNDPAQGRAVGGTFQVVINIFGYGFIFKGISQLAEQLFQFLGAEEIEEHHQVTAFGIAE